MTILDHDRCNNDDCYYDSEDIGDDVYDKYDDFDDNDGKSLIFYFSFAIIFTIVLAHCQDNTILQRY